MTDFEKIHVLTKELLVIYNELDEEAKSIVDEHITSCPDCKGLFETYHSTFVFNNQRFCLEQAEQSTEIKPFKKLIQFKTIMYVLLIGIRFLLLSLILNKSFDPTRPALLRGSLIVYYFPFVGLSNIVTFVFYRKSWFWIMLLFDILILLFSADLIYTFF
ncbi:hypothetical protein ACPVTF_02265 [Geobacillus icigianus]|uniref:Zinc-finger domain-containing protein n=1 Tax=Geobacillus subterraneus TaxID=129338 RepID=A0A679FQV3_9BACL|nr:MULTISPECIES: hypothetical protein [Geobacillus]BBW98463.1 hypothetical protein GsuE55_32960 [Geobacillus subterraneus]